MAYEQTVWKDRVAQRPRTYIESANADGSITHVPSEGTITETGTPVNASNLNKIENEIYRLGTQGATTTQKGIVQLVDNADSTSTSLAPTANALKQINDTLSTQLAEKAEQITALDEDKADKTEVNALATEKANQTALDITNANMTAGLGLKRDKSVLITTNDIDKSSDTTKIHLLDLAEEVQAAMAGTAPVISTVADGSLTEAKYAESSVSLSKLKFKTCQVITASSTHKIIVDFKANTITIPHASFVLFGQTQELLTTGSNMVVSLVGHLSVTTYLVVSKATKAVRLLPYSEPIGADEYVILMYYFSSANVNVVSDNAVEVIKLNGEVIKSVDYVRSTAQWGYVGVGTLSINTVAKTISFQPVSSVGIVIGSTNSYSAIPAQTLDYSGYSFAANDSYLYLNIETKEIKYTQFSAEITANSGIVILAVIVLSTGEIRSAVSTRNLLVNGFDPKADLPYRGLRWCAYGDSITNADEWKAAVVKALGFSTCYDMGWSDSAVTMEDSKTLYIYPDGTYAGNPLVNPQPEGSTEVHCSFSHADRVAYVPSNSDVITIMGGTNDLLRNLPLGNTSYTVVDGAKVYDEHTYIGALCATHQKIQKKIPTALVVLMTPITAVSAIGGEFPQRNAQGLSVVDYVKGTKEAALHLGCPIIDVHQCGITLHNSGNTLVDTVHPSVTGNKLIARKVVGGLKETSPL